MKKTITKVISVILCAVMLAGTSALFGFVSAEEYFENSRFHVKSKAELTAMYNNKEKFVLYCFRKTCGNSQYIWTNVVTGWCDTYGKDIYGTDVDSIGIPNFVWNACEGGTVNLPVIAFVDGDDVTVFTNTSGNTQLRSQIEEKFFDFYKIAPPEKENITYRYKVTFHQTEARTMLTAVNTLRLPENAWLWNETDTEQVFYRNLQPLVYDYDLERIAMQRAAETVARWKHQRPNGETPWSAYNVYGTCSENIAYGQKTAAEVENGWEEANEPYEGQGHRRNLLGENFGAIGIACAEFNGKRFWVQEFRDIVVDSAETPANDSLTEVSVEIAKEYMESKTLDSSGDRMLTLNAGSSVNLPALNYKIKMNTDPCYEIPAAYDPAWTCANTSIATVSGNKITGVSAGETYISANTDEGEIIYTVKVNAATVDPGHVHEFDTNEIIQKPTCTEEGIIQYTCSSCGYVTTSKLSPLNPAGHSFTRYVDNGDGTETAKCDRCDVTDTRKIGTSPDPVTPVAPTETDVPVHEHDWRVSKTEEPTCTAEGVTVYTCSCGETKTETVPAKGHSFTNYVYNNDATETADGTETAKCDRCDATDTRVKPGTRIEPADATETDIPVTPTETDVPVHEHVWRIGKTEVPTCTNEGVTVYTCSCGETKTETVPALGHKYSAYTYNNDATTEKDGTETAICSVCGNRDTRTKPGTRLSSVNPAERTVLNVGSGREIGYNEKVRIRASATNLPSEYRIVICDASGTVLKAGDRGQAAVEYESGGLTGLTEYTVKIVDTNGNTASSASGALEKKITINVKGGFFQIIIAFFKGLFGMLKTYDI